MTDDASACSLQQWYDSFVEFEGGGAALPTVTHPTLHSRTTRATHPTYIPLLVIGTHSDQSQKAPTNPRSLCRRVSKKLLSLQRTLASLLRQALFLPMPSFLASTGGSDVVIDSFRMRPNTRVLEWSCHDPDTKEIQDFLHAVLENAQPTV
eukprot:TRINITY_DN19687_c0_g1_i1.p1 TRINITY_DN19687_c0_g1~~TRINITY_DN19687_c0_g1_i1.p1  ORF type:complete len:166 (+),score=5.78 TRINITY_DN19687_c0_g1_i1:48-500(+)